MIIALSMLTVAFMGIATLLNRSFFLNRVATDETIGSYLASEGIEVTKSIIDNDVYGSGLSWGVCCAVGTHNYTVQYDSASLSLTNLGSYLKLHPDPTLPGAYLYQYNGTGSPSPFKRVITITVPANSHEIDVQSKVTWSTGPLTTETITDEDHFYDWHPS